jgi:predicted porin
LSTGTAAATTESQSNWELAASYKFGSNNIGAYYLKNGDLGARTATGAKMYSFRYGYKFFKDTELYAAYAKLDNDTNGNYTTLGSGTTVGAQSAGTVGRSQSGFGIGLIQAF